MKKNLLTGTEVLLVEDDLMMRRKLTSYLERGGSEVTQACNIEEAIRCLDSLSFDFVLLDINLPDGSGLDLLRKQHVSKITHVIVMTADQGIETAVEAMRLGASDYLTKPFDPEELPLVFQRCRQAEQSHRREDYQKSSKANKLDNLFFDQNAPLLTEKINQILKTDQRLKDHLPPILIEGETGTGKTTIARYLHQKGPRSDFPFVEINCSTLPEALAESELFGHEQGAFTDAKSARIGLFEAADQGTLFLDEVSSLSAAVQAKLLIAIEEGKIRRVGGNREIEVNVRIIAASNQSLGNAVSEGRFREDLFHRLDLLRLPLPPLREKRQDLVALAEFLTENISARYRVPPPPISEKGKKRLLAYSWPGNIRELSHELERQIILGSDQPLDFESLKSYVQTEQESESSNPDWLNKEWSFPPSGFDLKEAELRFIQLALEQTEGNVSRAAKLLGVPRDFLRYRLEDKKKE